VIASDAAVAQGRLASIPPPSPTWPQRLCNIMYPLVRKGEPVKVGQAVEKRGLIPVRADQVRCPTGGEGGGGGDGLHAHAVERIPGARVWVRRR
jgi:hypothetical protein